MPILILLVLVISCAVCVEPSIEDEITEVFVDTCYLAVVRNDDWGSIPDDEAVNLLKEAQSAYVEGLIEDMTPRVEGRGREARLETYQSSLEACIRSGGRYAF